MKTSLKKLKGLASLKHGHRRDKRQRQPMAQWEEIALADQEMQEIKDCYDKLVSAAAATANSSYELSESFKEIGDCLLEKTGHSNFEDEESGKVLLMLGKVQLELQRLVDVYRSHISRTITVPSESLLNELQTVEEMKLQCEEKRLAYEEALKRHKEKGKLKNAKDSFPSQNLQTASDDYDQEANSFLFRMRSLKQGQYRSLLTQTARHHAAQLTFFKKAYTCLEAIEPYVRSVAESHHIDYDFSGLEDDNGDGNDHEHSEGDHADAGSTTDDSEHSFDCKEDQTRQYTKKPMEDVEQLSPHSNAFSFGKEMRESTISVPFFAVRTSVEMQSSSSQKHMSYVLPTPTEVKSPMSARSKSRDIERRQQRLPFFRSYHSSPLHKKNFHLAATDMISGPLLLDKKSVLRDNNQYNPIGSAQDPLLSRPILRTPTGHSSITKLPSHASSLFKSSPKISELHELPRPPPNLTFNRPSYRFGYLESLHQKGSEVSTANKVEDSVDVLKLPMPPHLTRSLSIPTRGHITEPMVNEISPRPLTPNTLPRFH